MEKDKMVEILKQELNSFGIGGNMISEHGINSFAENMLSLQNKPKIDTEELKKSIDIAMNKAYFSGINNERSPIFDKMVNEEKNNIVNKFASSVKEREWVSVEDRMPNIETLINIEAIDGGGHKYKGTYCKNYKWRDQSSCLRSAVKWRELP